MTIRARLGYTAAGLTLAAALLTPFVLMGMFSKGVAALGLKVDGMYSGGPVVRTIAKNGYMVDVHQVVRPHMLQSERPFVQMDWKPVRALPGHVDDAVDIDGDGNADVRVTFDLPREPKAPMRVDVVALNPAYEGMTGVGKDRFSRLIARVDDAVVVRVVKGRE